MPTKPINLRIETELLEYLESRAAKEHRTLSNMIISILLDEEFNIMENNQVHLCNSCFKSYPECSDDEHSIEFGDGIGCDNICCCNKYEPLLERDYERGGYK